MPDARPSEHRADSPASSRMLSAPSRRILAGAVACTLVVPVLLFLFFVSPGEEATGNPAAPDGPPRAVENVFIVVIDGLRASEAFDDPSHRYIPNIWNRLRPLGTIYTNFINASHTSTTSAHAAITSGTVQFIPNTLQKVFGDIERIQEEPSIFQYYRHQLGIPQDRTWIVNGKGDFIKYSGISRDPFFADRGGPRVAFDMILDDDKTWQAAQAVIDNFHPSLALVNFAHVDGAGHSGDWKQYTDAILHADHLVHELCRKILLDPVYRNKTAIFITSDHGRHAPGVKSGFQDHGCSCKGCRRVPLLAIGPGIRKSHVVTREGRLIDIVPTVAAMLGVEMRIRNGRVLRGMFDMPPPAEPDSLWRPCTASAGGILHLASTRSGEGTSRIEYTRSLDGGVTWSTPIRLTSEPQNMFPAMAASGNRVAVTWTCTMSDGEIRTALSESADGGVTWTGPFYLPGDDPLRPDLDPDLSYFNNLLCLVWSEPSQGKSSLHVARFDHGIFAGRETMTWPFLNNTRCDATGAGVHAVFQKLNLTDRNHEIGYARHDGSRWLPTVFLTGSPGESIDPDIAVDTSGIHVVWAEELQGTFRIVSRSSLDGVTWDAPKLVGSSTLGAWRPRIESTAKGLIVVWEGYDSGNPFIVAAASKDGGRTWSPSFRITVPGGCEACPVHTIDSKGLLHIFWEKGPWPSTIGRERFRL